MGWSHVTSDETFITELRYELMNNKVWHRYVVDREHHVEMLFTRTKTYVNVSSVDHDCDGHSLFRTKVYTRGDVPRFMKTYYEDGQEPYEVDLRPYFDRNCRFIVRH